MAVRQISKVQVRTGTSDQSVELSNGELGWTQNSRELYIGNGTPHTGKTRILTEFSTQGGNIIANDSYGISPTNLDNTNAINKLLASTTSQGRTIYFPKGEYNILGTINIPSNTTIIGDGPESTIFKRSKFQSVHIKITNGGTGYTSIPTITISNAPSDGVNATAMAAVDPNGVVSGITITNGGTGYTSTPTITIRGGGGGSGLVLEASITNQIARTSGTNPENISINGCSFRSIVNAVDGGDEEECFYIENTTGISFSNVEFKGRETTIPTAISDAKNGVRIISGKNISFYNCIFSDKNIGLYTRSFNRYIYDVSVINCRFNNLYIGFRHDTALQSNSNGSATAMNSVFENIYDRAINTINTTNNFTSISNSFVNCGVGGNDLTGAAISPVIDFNNQTANHSINDSFSRTTAQETAHPNVNSYGLILNDSGLQYGLEKTAPVVQNVALNYIRSSSTPVSVPGLTFNSNMSEILYTITRGSNTSSGRWRIRRNGSAWQVDNSNIDDRINMTFGSDSSGNLTYRMNEAASTGINATLKYQIITLK